MEALSKSTNIYRGKPWKTRKTNYRLSDVIHIDDITISLWSVFHIYAKKADLIVKQGTLARLWRKEPWNIWVTGKML